MSLMFIIAIIVLTDATFEFQCFKTVRKYPIQFLVQGIIHGVPACGAFPTTLLHALFADKFVTSIALNRIPAHTETYQANKVITDRVSNFTLRSRTILYQLFT